MREYPNYQIDVEKYFNTKGYKSVDAIIYTLTKEEYKFYETIKNKFKEECKNGNDIINFAKEVFNINKNDWRKVICSITGGYESNKSDIDIFVEFLYDYCQLDSNDVGYTDNGFTIFEITFGIIDLCFRVDVNFDNNMVVGKDLSIVYKASNKHIENIVKDFMKTYKGEDLKTDLKEFINKL